MMDAAEARDDGEPLPRIIPRRRRACGCPRHSEWYRLSCCGASDLSVCPHQQHRDPQYDPECDRYKGCDAIPSIASRPSARPSHDARAPIIGQQIERRCVPLVLAGDATHPTAGGRMNQSLFLIASLSIAEAVAQSRGRFSSISTSYRDSAVILRGRPIHHRETPSSGADYGALSISRSAPSSRLMGNRKPAMRVVMVRMTPRMTGNPFNRHASCAGATVPAFTGG